MDVLLVGGTGFLGGHVARELLARGHRVAAIGRGTRVAIAGLEMLALDRRDPAALRAALAGRRFDFTVDLAAYGAADVESLFQIRRLQLGPYVLVSTGQVYLVTTNREMPYREDQSRSPLLAEPATGTPDHREWTYGIGKRRAEAALLALRAFGVRATLLRLPVLVGEGDTSLRLWAYLERLLDGGPLLLPDGGARPLRFLHPGDAARAIAGWVEGGLPRGAVYNLAQPDLVTLRSTIEAVAAAAGVRPRLAGMALAEIEKAGLPRAFSPWSGPWVSVLDPGRAEAEWGFTGTPMADYLPDVVRWHLENRPPASHPGFRLRAREVELAEAALRAGRDETRMV